MKLEFMPGCFDQFEGTQEELNQLVAEIQRMFDSGDYLEHMIDITDEENLEIQEKIANSQPRTLQ